MPDDPALPDWVSTSASRAGQQSPTVSRRPEPRRPGVHRSAPGPTPASTFLRRRLVVAFVVTTLLALLLWIAWPDGGSRAPERAAADPAPAALTRVDSPPTAAAEDSDETQATRTPDPEATPVPVAGTGQVDGVSLPAVAAPTVEPRRTVRVGLQAERGAGVDAVEAATIISATLGEPRGWQTHDRVRFRVVTPQAVAAGEVDITIVLASPTLTDDLCAPLRTRGKVSCFNGGKVVLNVRRWMEGVSGYGTDLAAYRQYMVNHEVGHGLYHGHVGCPTDGAPAPIMLQQSKGLDGCRPNPWPTVG